MNTEDMCDAHACPLPCVMCEEISEATRAFDEIERKSHELRALYDNANQRRSRALRMLGAATLAERPNPVSVAWSIVAKIEADLNNRRDFHIDSLDDETQAEIRATWHEAIVEILNA